MILLKVYMLITVSTIIGTFFGLMTSLLFKHARFISKSAITETLIMFCFSWIAYLITDSIKIVHTHMSGDLS